MVDLLRGVMYRSGRRILWRPSDPRTYRISISPIPFRYGRTGCLGDPSLHSGSCFFDGSIDHLFFDRRRLGRTSSYEYPSRRIPLVFEPIRSLARRATIVFVCFPRDANCDTSIHNRDEVRSSLVAVLYTNGVDRSDFIDLLPHSRWLLGLYLLSG